MRRWLLISTLFGLSLPGLAQQANLMFFANHYLPETHYLNPASTCPCESFIGLPVLSSIYFNYGNSAFSYSDLLGNNNSYSTSTVDNTIGNLGRRSYLGLESRIQWLALGHKFPKFYLNFSISEVIEVPTTFPKDLFEIIWKGNSAFEGDFASAKGTGIYFHHYRAYALGISKPIDEHTLVGLRAKLLFGKLNLTTRGTSVDLYTEPHTFDLSLQGKLNVNSSLPIEVIMDNNDPGLLDTILLDKNISPGQLLFNRKNPGFAIDAGIIRNYGNGLRMMASINDLGFIRYRSNLNNFHTSKEIIYRGVNFDTVQQQPQFSQLFSDTLRVDHSTNKYTYWLPPVIRVGAQFPLGDKLTPGLGITAKWYNTKLQTSAHLNVDYRLLPSVHILAGYTLQYRTYNSIGLGLVGGRGPLQFYAFSDHVTGLIWPLKARNINLQFGLNINLGCHQKTTKAPNASEFFGQVPCPDIFPRQSKFKIKALRKRNEK